MLKMADNHVLSCQGTVRNLQVLAGPYKERLNFVCANIGEDNIIIGGEVMEMAEGGFGRPGFWRMLVDGNYVEIPLIGEHSSSLEVKQVRSVKKATRMLRDHLEYVLVGRIWRAEEGVAQSDDSQDADAQDGLLGVDRLKTAIEQASDCKSARTTSSKSVKHAQRLARNTAIEQQIESDRKHMAAASARMKAQLKQEFPRLFSEPMGLPPLRWENHRVELEPGARAPPVRGLPRMSKAEMDETRNFLTSMLAKGWVMPSLGNYGAPFFFVPKPSGRGLRAVCDYRAINSITKKVLPSLPLFENIVTQLDGARFFSGLDLTSQFYQIRVEPEDIEKTSFRTCFGLYNWTVCPMGMTGSTGSAMNAMQQVLQHVISLPGEDLPENPRAKPPLPPQPQYPSDGRWKHFSYHSALGTYCCLFVDDILVYSKTEDEHLRHLRQICTTLEQHHLYLNFDKIEICQPEITYLGNRVGRYGIRPTQERTQALIGWPPPQSVSELKSFLGLLGFIRRYVPDMAQIAVPLTNLLKKQVPWVWGDAQQQAFDKLKRRCASTPVLAIPEEDAELVLRCDASREAMGAALYQRDSKGFLQPVEFKSKAFAEPQKRLPAHDREALGLLYALKSFRYFLLRRRFEVQTDNSALSQIFTSKDLSDLYARWYHKIAEFEGITIKHRPGRKLYCADALSRRRTAPNDDRTPFQVEPGVLYKTEADRAECSQHINAHARWSVELGQSASHVFSLKITDASARHTASMAQDPAQVCGQSAAYQCHNLEPAAMQGYRLRWPALYAADPDLHALWKAEGDVKWGYFIHQGLMWKHGPAGARLCVPQEEGNNDKISILQAMHDSKSAGHAGVRRTLAKLQGNFYWKGMYGDAVAYVESCHKCQVSKINRQARMGEPRALQARVPDNPWAVVHMDWITGLPTSSEGYDAILVFVCALTGMIHLQPCKKTDSAKETAGHFVHNVVRLHGVPDSIVSDRDIRLRAHFWRALQQRLGCELRFTTANTPNSNGKVERVNAVLGDVLRSMCKWSGADWVQNLDLAEFAINGSESSATGFTPFFANYAREPRMPANVGKPSLEVPAAVEMADAMFATIVHTRDALERSKRQYELATAWKRRPSDVFAAGDLVLLSTKNLNLKMEARNLTCKFVGPFEVRDPPDNATNPNVVWLKVPRAFKIHMPVNLKDIKRYKLRPDQLGCPEEVMPEPIVLDGVDCWEVEEVLAEREHRNQRQVLVKWTGLSIMDSTWEPIDNILQQFLDSFHGLQKEEEF